MYQNLKTEIKEMIEIVKQCPEGLQEKCFELLLENYLTSNGKCQKEPEPIQPHEKIGYNPTNASTDLRIDTKTPKSTDEEISEKDFHIKVRKFLEASGISMDMINALYYKENGKLMPLYESLKSNKMTDCQNRVTLLSAFENSFSNSGEMNVNGEMVRQRCQDLKCYDAPHFADTFKRFSTYFDNWEEKYDKKIQYSLSAEGKKELAKILLELAEGE